MLKNKKKNEPLTSQELKFLYEVNTSIEGFGYDKDPRIKELRDKRNLKDDLLIIFECESNQIATNPDELNENTKVYIGPVCKVIPGIQDVRPTLPDPKYINIFKRLQNVEYIYTEFPEKKIFRKNIELTTKTSQEYTDLLISEGNKISGWAQDMLDKIEPLKQNENIDLVYFSISELGFPNGATLREIYDRVKKFGLELCPPQVGPELRLNYKDQLENEWLLIAMEPISDRDSDPLLFGVSRYASESWLYNGNARFDNHWYGDDRFVFRLRKDT